jgi:uncharacterized membrane protein
LLTTYLTPWSVKVAGLAFGSRQVPGVPAGDGYLLIQAADVHKKGHKVLISGTDLPGTELDKTVRRVVDRLYTVQD